MVLSEILEHALAAGVSRLVGVYRPTDRNKLVIDHYSRLGFTKVEEDDSGTTRWELTVTKSHAANAPMKVISKNFPIIVEESTA